MAPEKPRPLLVPTQSTRPHPAKSIDTHLTTDLKIARRSANFANKPLGLAIGLGQQLDPGGRPLACTLAVELGNMTSLARRPDDGLIEKTQLNCLVAIAIDSADLQDIAGTGLQRPSPGRLAPIIIHLRHPDLAAEYPDDLSSLAMCISLELIDLQVICPLCAGDTRRSEAYPRDFQHMI